MLQMDALNHRPDSLAHWRHRISLRLSQVWAVVVVVFFLGGEQASPAAEVPSRVYAEYDREFKTFLTEANRRAGKEVIKVKRLSDRFTVPQKLNIKGRPYEMGLCLGHMGRQ